MVGASARKARSGAELWLNFVALKHVPVSFPAWARSLFYGVESRPLTTYEVVKPFEVDAGTAAPWFGQPGGGIQYDLGTQTVQDLIDSGHLRIAK